MKTLAKNPLKSKHLATSTVGRGRTVREITTNEMDMTRWSDNLISVRLGDSLEHYPQWSTPAVIVSDGGYGVLGFEGDTSDHLALPEWYEPHIAAWSKQATPATTLWFWNSEIGWAAVHPILEKHGWRYMNANIWNKGKGHIAGNINTAKIRRFPVVSEMCVQYVYEARIDGLELKAWLLKEWKRTGLPTNKANEACGVANVATRKYLDQGHLWYFPPPEMFVRMQEYANMHGNPAGRPYFAIDGVHPGSAEQWAALRSKFNCPHGFTNVWERNALRGGERCKKHGNSGRAIHLNQKPLDLMTMIITASSDENDVIWEPFGGLFTACLAARSSGRRAFGAEIDPTYFYYGLHRLTQASRSCSLLESQRTE
ncbi:MAG TPA: DNA methyltransferase [Ktedonobacteraceae bacterium]|jgi:site-specific DNA-methyltransferase (adenine-specific)